jgi:hypothetical protein
MADSLDSYAALSELASSGRFVYIPANNNYGQTYLPSAAGRYGGNALRMICSGVSAGGVANSQINSQYGYTSNQMVPITIPGYMTGNWTTNPYYQKALQFGFWFKSVTAASGTVTNVGILAQSCAGSSSTVLYSGSALGLGNFLTYTPASSVITQGTLNMYQLGSASLFTSATCPVNLNDGNWHWIEICVVPYVGTPQGYTPQGYLGAAYPPFWARVYVDQQMVINVTTGGGTVSSNGYYYSFYAAFFLIYNGYITNSQTAGTADGNYYDDLLACVSVSAPSFPFGPRRMVCMRPNADGDVIGYAPVGAADNYLAINKGYSNTTSYVQSTGYNIQDRYKFPALSYVPQNINAVITNIQAGNFEPGTAIGMSPTLFDGTADVSAPRQTLPQYKYNPYQTIYETDNEGNPWSTSEVNSIQVGFKSIA